MRGLSSRERSGEEDELRWEGPYLLGLLFCVHFFLYKLVKKPACASQSIL